MDVKANPSRDPAALRRTAEDSVKRRTANPPPPGADLGRLQHELEVHKTELEMQNEELLASHAELQTALERYTDLYDFAPVGYLTLGPDGEIRQLNLAAASLLGEDRSRLANRRLGQFVCPTNRAAFAAFLKSVFATQNPEACEVTLSPAAGPAPVVHIEAALTPSGEECRAVLTNITERRQGEKALRESEARRALAMSAAKAGSWEWEVATGRQVWSDELWEMYGLVPHSCEPSYEAWRQTVHPDDREPIKRALSEAIRQGAELSLEWRVRGPKGSDRWLAAHGGPLRDEAGRASRYLGIVMDITPRKRAEEELKQRQELQDRFARIATTVPGMIYSFQLRPDGSTCMPYSTPAVEDIWGWRPEDVREDFSPAMALVHPEDLPPLQESIAESARTMTAWQHTFRIQHPRKGERWLEGHSIPRREPDGGVLWHGFVHDVTKHRRADKDLETALVKYRTLFDLFPLGITVADKQGNIVEANRMANKLLGLSAEEQRQRHISGKEWKIIHPDGTPMPADDYASVRALREHRLVENVEMGLVKSADETVWLNVAAAPLGDYGVVITYGDITERKRLDAHLRQAQKLEGIGQLAGGVAHDFNNILTAITVQVGLLETNSNLDEEMREGLKEIEREARRASDVTRQLLMFSRRSVLAMKPLDLNEVVANLLKMLRRLIGETIELRFEVRGTLPAVKADAGLMGQVLMNLAVNARDAMPVGGCITISTALAELGPDEAAGNSDRRPGRFVCLTVADTGCGMDPATLKQVFEPFFTTKETGKGTGLGLATVHGIVAQHRGWVEVKSAPGAGTAFHVFLPAEAQLAAGDLESALEGALPRGRETILLVEDDDDVRRVAGRSLRSQGYQVHEAADGPEAMAAWQTHGAKVDLVLTDMVMPGGMSGLELAEALRGLKPGLKAIVTSGYSDQMALAGLPRNLDVTYLPKPFTTKALAELVRACLDRKG